MSSHDTLEDGKIHLKYLCNHTSAIECRRRKQSLMCVWLTDSWYELKFAMLLESVESVSETHDDDLSAPKNQYWVIVKCKESQTTTKTTNHALKSWQNYTRKLPPCLWHTNDKNHGVANTHTPQDFLIVVLNVMKVSELPLLCHCNCPSNVTLTLPSTLLSEQTTCLSAYVVWSVYPSYALRELHLRVKLINSLNLLVWLSGRLCFL